MSCIIACCAQAAKNPFEKTHPIGADYFLKADADRIEGIIKKGLEKVKDVDFKKAEEYFEQADERIQNIRPGEKEELRDKKDSLIQSLKESKLFLSHYKDFVDVDALFRENKELEDAAFTTHRSKLKDEVFQKFVLEQYKRDEYKTGWVYLAIGDYENAIEHLANVSSQKANYLRGVAQLEKADELRHESALDVAVREYEAAEKIFSLEGFQEPVLSLVKEKGGIANAWRIWLTLEGQVFGENARRRDLIRYWEEIWLLVPDIGQGLPALNSNVAQTPLDIVAADDENIGFKLGWFYSAIGWYEKALQYLDENAIAKISGDDRFYAYYFYGKAKEAMYTPNVMKEPLSLSRMGVYPRERQMSEFDQTQIEAAYRAYSEALKYAQSGQFDPNIASYMKRCCKAWGKLIETPASHQDAYLALEKYKAALRVCAENFYIQHQLLDFFRQHWSAYDKLGFSFHGPDGYYSIYFDGGDKILYENSIKLISLLQLFLSRDYVTVSENRWQSYYSFSPREAKLLGESIEASIRDILENEFLSKHIFSGNAVEFFSLAKSLSLRASSPEDWNEIMMNLATAVERRYGLQQEDASVEVQAQNALRILADKNKPFRYAEAWYRRARLYEEKGIWAKATECYVKSLSLLPTGETYEKLGALLLRLSEQNPSDTILQNANFCMEQAGKLRLSRFPGRW